MKGKRILRPLRFLFALAFFFLASSAYGADANRFSPGAKVPDFTVGVPYSPEVQKYLGLKNSDPFKVSDIAARIVLVEFTNSM
jgi:hypothetical protein